MPGAQGVCRLRHPQSGDAQAEHLRLVDLHGHQHRRAQVLSKLRCNVVKWVGQAICYRHRARGPPAPKQHGHKELLMQYAVLSCVKHLRPSLPCVKLHEFWAFLNQAWCRDAQRAPMDSAASWLCRGKSATGERPCPLGSEVGEVSVVLIFLIKKALLLVPPGKHQTVMLVDFPAAVRLQGSITTS